MKRQVRPNLQPMREQTLSELEGVIWGPPTYHSYLVETIHRLRNKPIGAFTVEDLRITIGQAVGLPYLLPLALEALEQNPLVSGAFYPGDLLLSVLGAETRWPPGSAIRERVAVILDQALATLVKIGPTDWLAEGPDLDTPGERERDRLEPILQAALTRLRTAEGKRLPGTTPSGRARRRRGKAP